MGVEPQEPVKFTYDLIFQKKILRTLYQEPDIALTTGSHLSHETFEKPAYRWLAQRILQYAQKYASGITRDALKIQMQQDVKSGRLNTKIRGEAEALVQTIDKPVKDRSFVREELYKFVKFQHVKRALINIVEGGLLDAQDLDGIDREMENVIAVQDAVGGGLGHFFVRDRKQRMLRRKAAVKDGISTGLKVDDYLRPGGLPRKGHHLTTVIAPSGVGKSQILVYMARSAIIENHVPVLYITTELSEEAVCDRFDAAITGTGVSDLETKRRSVSAHVRNMGEQYGEFLVVKEFAEATHTATSIRAYVRQLERVGFYPGLIIVDSADDLEPEHHGRERDSYTDYGVIWTNLRRVSHEVRAPIVTASQTQRDALNKEFVDWDKTSDSAKKIHKSDLALIFQQTKDEKKKSRGRVHIAKNRLGQDKIEVKVRVDWSRSMMWDL